MATKAGDIYYDIELETAQLIEGQRQVSERLDQIDKDMQRSARSAATLDTSMSKLASTIKAVIAASALREMANMVQKYQEMSERVQMASSSQKEFEHVQQRLLKTANGTYRSLSEAQELYITTAASLRSLGYSTDQAVDVQDSMSYAFVKNATSADRASGAISAFSKSINTGKVAADQWETITTAIPSVIEDIATASGKSAAEIRALGAAGKLTATQLSEGLRQSLEANSTAAAGMSNNLTDAGVRIKTAITSLLVSMENQTGALQAFTNGLISAADGILGFSQNTEVMPKVLDTVAIAAGIVAAVMASRYVGALAVATAENFRHAASALRVVAAQGAMATAARAGSFALSLVGGPAGAATLAATAIFYFYQKSQQAKQEALAFADGLDVLLSKMTKMSDVQISAEIAKASQALRSQEDAIKDQQKVVDALTRDIVGYGESMRIYGESSRQAKNMKAAQEELAIETAKLSDMQNKQSRTMSAIGLMQAQLNGQRKEGIDLLSRENQQTSISEGLMNKLGTAINFAAKAKENFNASSLKVDRSADADKLLKNLEQENALLAITDKRERAIAEARQNAMNAGAKAGSNQLRQIEEQAAKKYDQLKAEEELKKATKDANAETKKSENQYESAALKIERLRQEVELAASATENLTKEEAMLKAEQSLGKGATAEQIADIRALTAAKIDQANASRAAALIPEMAENQSYKADLEALKSSLTLKKIDQNQYYTAVEQREQQHQANLAKIRSDAAVTPQQEAKATVDPVQALANENARKLALIQQFEAAKTLTQNEAEALRNATATEYEQQRIAAQWEIYRNQSTANELLATSIESMQSGATNAITGLLNGTQSLSQAFANIGTSILNGVVGSLVQMGTQWVMSAVMGQTAQTGAIAANQAAATAALTASTAAGVAAASTLLASWSPVAMAASIATSGGAATAGLAGYTTAMTTAKTMSIAGARYNGGPVSAGSMYQVGESGKPEIFKASNGSQYMIPGDNGSVISNRDLSGSAGGGTSVQQTNHFTINTTGGIDDATMAQLATMMKQVSLSTIKNEQRPNGLLRK